MRQVPRWQPPTFSCWQSISACYSLFPAAVVVLQVCFTAVREVLSKSGVTPRQVGCVIVNCSLFNPTPSLSALIMNHFKMASNTINYNLGGMGCSGVSVVCVHWGRS